jgi:hypothetical protein
MLIKDGMMVVFILKGITGYIEQQTQTIEYMQSDLHSMVALFLVELATTMNEDV